MKNPYFKKSLEFDKHLLKMPLVESGEKMVSLKELAKKYGVNIVFNKKAIILKGDKKIFYLRETVAHSLMKAAKRINEKGYALQIQDAYRNPKNQMEKFKARVNEMKSLFPKKKYGQLLISANAYTAGIPILAAHTAGAAVDVILLDGYLKKVDMGSEYPEAVMQSATDFKKLPKNILVLRQMLVTVMETEGFTNYPFEWWHFSIGDVCDTYIKKKKHAVYGPMYFEPQTGKTKAMPKGQCYSYFAI